MICANALHQGPSFNARTSPAGVMALTAGIPSGPEEEGFFFNLLQTQIQKGKIFKNPATTEQRSSPQGCTVRPIISAGLSSLGGV